MAIKDFPAKLDNFGLDIATTTDIYEKMLALHERPFTNTAISQDLGFRARRVRLETSWYDSTAPRDDDALLPTFDQHRSFITHLKNGKLFTLMHPKYGIIYGNVSAIEVHCDDTQRYAAVKLEFVEEQTKISTSGNDAFFDLLSSFNNSYANSVYPITTFTNTQIQTDLGTQATVLTNITNYDESKSILDNLSKATTQARNYAKKLDTFVATCQAFLAQVEEPPDSFVSLISYGVNVPGTLMGAAAHAINRITLFNNQLVDSPTQLVESCNRGIEELKTSIDNLGISFLPVLVCVMGGTVLGQVLSNLLVSDQQNREDLLNKEQNPSFSPGGSPVQPLGPIQVYSVGDLEGSLYNYKSLVQNAIGTFVVTVDGLGNTMIVLTGPDNRDLQFLLEMTRLMQDYISNIKLTRLQIKTITVNEQPLHVILMANGLSYQAAERVLKLNPQIQCPTFTSGDIEIYAR